MKWSEFKQRCGNFRKMAPKEIAFVVVCFLVVIVLCIIYFTGIV